MLNLGRILRFVAIAEELSFTRAAKRLGVDQSSLSRQIMQLEAELGAPLFNRNERRIELTPAGGELLEYARRLGAAADEVQQKIDEMSRRRAFDLRIGAAYATYWFPAREALLARYRNSRRQCEIKMVETEFSDGVIELLQNGAVDVGFLVGPLGDVDLETKLIERSAISLAIPKEDSLAELTSVELADLKGRRVAISQRTPSFARYRNVYGWIDDVGAIPVLVPEGRRFIYDAAQRQRLIVPSLTPQETSRMEDFVQRPIRGSNRYFDLYIARRKGAPRPGVHRFWELGDEFPGEEIISVAE